MAIPCRNNDPSMKAILLLPLLLLTACTATPEAVKPLKNTSDALPRHPLVIINHGWHTGLALPADQIKHHLPMMSSGLPDAGWYEFGWGDAGYYRAEQKSLWLGARALFWPSPTVMHQVALTDHPDQSLHGTERLHHCLTDAELASLLTFLQQSYQQDADGRRLHLGSGRYGQSDFHQANGHYHLFNTCNNWTARGLQSSGMRLTAANRMTAGSLMRVARQQVSDCP
jgi:uncharacterized protein (TIGR02117 family)